MSLNIKGLSFLTAALLSVVAPQARASDFQSPRTVALGGAGHAGPMLNDAIYLNPSYVSLLPTYAVSGNYFMFNGLGEARDPHGRGLNASIQDGRSELFQAGAGFTIRDNENILNIGASKALIQRGGVGVGGKFIFPKNGTRKMITETSLSTSYVPLGWAQGALIVDNLLQSDEAKAQGIYRKIILGTKVNIQSIVLIYFDPQLSPDDPRGSSYGFESGVEWPVMNDFFLRVGMYRNATIPVSYDRGRGYGMGFGWIAPRISLDYGYARVVEPVAFTAHVFGFTAYF
jgi:hypothetical protein